MVTWLRPFAGVLFVAAMAIRIAERRIVEALERADALDPARATPLSLSNPIRRLQFRRLLAAGAIGETADSRVYLNTPVYAEYRGRRRMRALIIIPVVVLLGYLAYSVAG